MTSTNISPRVKPFTALAELIAQQAAAAGKSHDDAENNTRAALDDDDDYDDDGEDHYAPLPKRLRLDKDGPPDYIAPFTRGAIGHTFVVIKGIKPGIYSDWRTFQHQVYKVPGNESHFFVYPRRAWEYYETKRRAGELEYLSRPPSALPLPEQLGGFISLENPWPEEARAFVVFRGLRPGPYKTWGGCYRNIINCDGPSYCGFYTYSEAVYAYSVAQLNGRTEWLEKIAK